MDLDKLKVVDLRKELQQRGLDTKGVKAALVKRLKDALDAESQDSKPSETEPQAQSEAEEENEPEDEPEETSPVKDPPKSASPEKQPPSTPKQEGSPVKKVATPVKEVAPEVEPETEPTPENQPSEVEPMETESRGEKRKRDDDDDSEEVEVQEKKRREGDEPEKVAPAESTVPAPAVKERVPPKEEEPELDYEKPQLSWFDSDLHLKIDNKTFLSATPLNDGCFGYIWAGARATHGISAGKICFEVKITEELKWEDLSDRMQEKVDRQLNQKYRIDRRKERQEETKEKSENEGDNSEENKEQTEEPTVEENVEEKGEKEEETAVEPEEAQNGASSQEEEKKEEENDEPEKQKETPEEEEKPEEEKKKPEEVKPVLPPIPTHFFRVGFSMPGTSLQLGEVKYSYAYESTGKFLTEGKFDDYGVTFGVGDVIGAYLAIDNQNVTITYTVNGAIQPTAITVPRSELPQDQFSLFPHVLCRNYAYELNFGALEEPWFPQPEELKTYQFLQQIEQKVEGPRRPEKREDCEVLLMVGLPGSGKTQWVKNHIAANSDKNYTVIGNHPLFDRMTVEGESMKSRFRGSWKILVDRIQKCLNQLTDRAALRRRNYIIDQTNVFPNAQRRKLRSFDGFNRKAVIVVCDDEEHARRQKDQQNDYGKTVPESTMYDLKAQMELPKKCEWVEELIFTDLGEEEARQKVKSYNEEANRKGYYKRWLNDNRKHPRNFRPGGRRGGFAPRGGRFGRFPPQGPSWNRPPPSWGGRNDSRGPPSSFRQGGAPWNAPQRVPPRVPEQNRQRYNRNAGGYGGGRGQGGRNHWQNGGGSNWGGNNQGGWNASLYGAHGYGAWNQNSANAQQTAAYKYGATQSTYGSGQGQRGYGGGSQGYGNHSQSYGSQDGYSQNWYGNQGGGYSDNWNYYGQQGWGSQKRQ